MLVSFRDVSPRVAWLRAILLAATFTGMLACTPLWMSAREYPLVPVAPWVPALPPPWDQISFAAALVSLIVACFFYRLGVVLFLLGSLFLVLVDQNRAQPWFYIFWVLLLLSLAQSPANLAACRFALAAVYVWSGIQKCNPAFFNQVVPWMTYPASNWLGVGPFQLVRWLIVAMPFIEISIGIALWFHFTRLMAIIAAVVVHASALLLLGPLGHKVNFALWPWNLGMIALVIILFPRAPIGKTADLEGYFPVAVVVAAFWLLPILSFFGKWPSYLSFAAYSGNVAKADLFVTDSFRERLPESLRSYIQPTQTPFNPQIQGPFIFDHQHWAMKELGAPAFPEPDGFLAIARYLIAQYSGKPSEVRLIIAPRYGPTVLYQGSQSWMIVPSR